MSEFEEKDWRDTIDRDIIPYVEYPGYEYKYPALYGLGITEEIVDEIRTASGKLYHIFDKATKVFQNCPKDFMVKMDMPENLIPYLNIKNPMQLPTFMSRFDYVISKNGNIHMVEINADTPCAIPEAYYGNTLFNKFFNCEEDDTNALSYQNLQNFLKDVFMKIYTVDVDLSTGRLNHRPFVFACFDDYVEDKGNTMFLMNCMKEALKDTAFAPYIDSKIRFESFYDLKVDDSGNIILPDGESPKVIYRLHPMELLIDEVADDGDSLGKMFMDGYKDGKFTMFNPPEAIIMQCKGFQALVWALHKSPEGRKIFTPEEIDCIDKYMLPTYFEEDFKANARNGIDYNLWIRKPIWGREGNGISVVDNTGTLIMEKVLDAPEEVVQREPKTCIYQEFVDQDMFETKTDDPELTEGYFTLSCFMLGAKPDALYARVSPEKIAGTEAYWAPLYIDNDAVHDTSERNYFVR